MGLFSEILTQGSTIYGFLALTYHSLDHFRHIARKEKKLEKKGKSKSKTQEVSEKENEYILGSRWVVFVSYVCLEPLFMYLFEFIPFWFIFVTYLKVKLFAMESEIYSHIYAQVFAKLSEFDIIEIVWKFCISHLLTFVLWLIKKFSYFYKHMNEEQLTYLENFYDDCIRTVQNEREKFIAKKDLRMSRLLNNPLTEYSRRAAGEVIETESVILSQENISIKSDDEKRGKKKTKRFGSAYIDDNVENYSNEKNDKQKERKK